MTNMVVNFEEKNCQAGTPYRAGIAANAALLLWPMAIWYSYIESMNR